MKTNCLAWFAAVLLALSGAARAQTTALYLGAPPAPLPAAHPQSPPAPEPPAAPENARPVLGGPPQPAPAPTAAEPGEAAELTQLRQLPLGAAGQPTQPPLAELARLFPQCVRPLASFRPDIAALATATAVAGSRGLVALTWPLGAGGVPAGGAAPGQRLQLLTTAGEQLVAVARPAAAGSHSLVVSAAPSLAGQSVVVAGLEHPAEQALDYEALTLLSLRTSQQLAEQLAAVQQQLAALRSQLAATQHLNGELLLDHAEQADLRQQLNLLQSQQAAASSMARPRRGLGWLPE